MKNFTKTAAAILGLALLPVPADAACTLKNLQGRYVAMIAGEFSGFWQRCDVSVDSSGLATGNCLVGTGDTLPLAVQFSVRPNCSVSGISENGVFHFSLKMQPHKRGLIGRFQADDGVNFFEGPVVAVKRGK